MNKIIKSSEVPGGNLSDVQRKFMRDINMNPTFDRKSKPWTLKKVLKSDTKITSWLVIYDGNFYLVTQGFRPRFGEVASIFNTDKRGKLDFKQRVAEFPQYVDMETAVDMFVDKMAREKMAANVEGTAEFNEANAEANAEAEN